MNLLKTAQETWKVIVREKWPSGFKAIVFSETLGESVVWAADNADIEKSHNLVIYRETLIRKILRAKLTPDGLKELHNLLKVLPEGHFQVTEILSRTPMNKLEVGHEIKN